jgi:nucleoside-diphosphate-sugar epimerase
MRSGNTAIDANVNLGPGFVQRDLHVHGLLGSAVCNLTANICTIDLGTKYGVDLDSYARASTAARQIRGQSLRTLGQTLLSKARLTKAVNHYEQSIRDSIANFHASITRGASVDDALTASRGRKIIALCEQILTKAGVTESQAAPPAPEPRRALAAPAKIIVFGGTGFIGSELIRQLVAAGHSVRAAVRGSAPTLQDIDPQKLEFVRIDLISSESIEAAVKGMDYVFHLARANVKTWDDYLKYDVGPTRLIAEACLAAKVKRFIYAGTIDSLYAGSKAGTIAAETPVDPNINRRNLYARAKAAGESACVDLFRTNGLPVVIIRPAIVIGRGGNPFHWGVCKWTSPGVCEVYGEGKNPLPFVLLGDVASALVKAMTAPGIEGRAFNISDVPLLSANEYLSELQRLTGMKIAVYHAPIWKLYAGDLLKWAVKMAVKHPDRIRVPSYDDWDSRTQKAVFDPSGAIKALGWQPASDRRRMIEEGIGGSLKGWLAAVA